jgi:hypothetical protein
MDLILILILIAQVCQIRRLYAIGDLLAEIKGAAK